MGYQTKPPIQKLSPREKQIVRGVAAGKSDKEISNELGITEGTVGQYMKVIFLKIGVNSRTKLAAAWASS